MTRRVFVDLDGVVADFGWLIRETGRKGEDLKDKVGAYLCLPLIPGAAAGVRSLIGMGYDVFFATKPPTGRAHAYADKVQWVLTHFPEMKRKIILTHDKGLLGGPEDVLIDDRPHKANCHEFRGRFIHFGSPEFRTWEQVLGELGGYAGWATCVGIGWRDLVSRAVAACHAQNVRVTDVKEKYGGLRVHYDPQNATPALDEIIYRIEYESYHVCETCGKPGRPRDKAWVKTLCDVHAEAK